MRFTIYKVKNGFTVKMKECTGIFIAADTYAIGKLINDFVTKEQEVIDKQNEIAALREEAN